MLINSSNIFIRRILLIAPVQIGGLVQNSSKANANALELLQSHTNSPKYYGLLQGVSRWGLNDVNAFLTRTFKNAFL